MLAGAIYAVFFLPDEMEVMDKMRRAVEDEITIAFILIDLAFLFGFYKSISFISHDKLFNLIIAAFILSLPMVFSNYFYQTMDMQPVVANLFMTYVAVFVAYGLHCAVVKDRLSHM